MKEEEIIKAIGEARKAKPRKFPQSFDLSISLKGVDITKPEHKIDELLTLPFAPGKKPRVCALVGRELELEAKQVCDLVLMKEDFEKLAKKPREIRKLARKYDFFLAQVDLMPRIAAIFGKYFGPLGKMPDPKAGCVVAANAKLSPIIEKLRKSVKLAVKKQPLINCKVGSEQMEDEEIAANIIAVYEAVRKKLPAGDQNIKSMHLKLTMGRSVRIK
jgi:large subunit ribosomal protein L1